MRVHIVIGFIMTTLLLMLAGLLSIYRPELVGAELSWFKDKRFLKYNKSTNIHYHKQIRVLGVGLLASALVMFLITIFYTFNPNMIYLLK